MRVVLRQLQVNGGGGHLVSLIICTYPLAQALTLTISHFPQAGWEFVVELLARVRSDASVRVQDGQERAFGFLIGPARRRLAEFSGGRQRQGHAGWLQEDHMGGAGGARGIRSSCVAPCQLTLDEVITAMLNWFRLGVKSDREGNREKKL